MAAPMHNTLSDFLEQGSRTSRCEICMEIFMPSMALSSIVSIEICGHRFHKECLREQLRRGNHHSCPTCGIVVFQTPEQKQQAIEKEEKALRTSQKKQLHDALNQMSNAIETIRDLMEWYVVNDVPVPKTTLQERQILDMARPGPEDPLGQEQWDALQLKLCKRDEDAVTAFQLQYPDVLLDPDSFHGFADRPWPIPESEEERAARSAEFREKGLPSMVHGWRVEDQLNAEASSTTQISSSPVLPSTAPGKISALDVSRYAGDVSDSSDNETVVNARHGRASSSQLSQVVSSANSRGRLKTPSRGHSEHGSPSDMSSPGIPTGVNFRNSSPVHFWSTLLQPQTAAPSVKTSCVSTDSTLSTVGRYFHHLPGSGDSSLVHGSSSSTIRGPSSAIPQGGSTASSFSLRTSASHSPPSKVPSVRGSQGRASSSHSASSFLPARSIKSPSIHSVSDRLSEASSIISEQRNPSPTAIQAWNRFQEQGRVHAKAIDGVVPQSDEWFRLHDRLDREWQRFKRQSMQSGSGNERHRQATLSPVQERREVTEEGSRQTRRRK